MKILVTGGAGFIGAALVRQLLDDSPHEVINLDKLTYAGNLESLKVFAAHPRHRFVQADIGDAVVLRTVFEEYRPDAVMHLAAESHVDRSIDVPGEFLRTNVVGTYLLLQESRRHWQQLTPSRAAQFRFLQVSTDEVYGSLDRHGLFREDSAYAPNSPYSASKAAADHLVRAWQHTYGLPTLVCHGSNTYGPGQFPEKLIPRMILNAIRGLPMPVYGQGENVRDWMHVDDHARALRQVLEKGRIGEHYNLGAGNPLRNIDLVRQLCTLLDELHPRGAPHAPLIHHVEDRPGHDLRYAIDAGKLRRELGWQPRQPFEQGLRATVAWYVAHRERWQDLRAPHVGTAQSS